MKKLLLLLFFCCLACELNKNQDPTCLLYFNSPLKIQLRNTSILLPEINWYPLKYQILATGPSGQNQEFNTSDDFFSISYLEFGLWSLQVNCFSDDDILLGTANAQIWISKSQSRHSFNLIPPDGTGELHLVFNWPPTYIENPHLQYHLTSCSDETISYSGEFLQENPELLMNLGSGYWKLQLTLLDDHQNIFYAQTCLLLLLKDTVTESQVNLNLFPLHGQGDFNFPEFQTIPLSPTIYPPLQAALAHHPLHFKAKLENSIPHYSFSWFLNNQLILHDNQAYFDANLSAGFYSLDLLLENSETGQMGSSHLAFQVKNHDISTPLNWLHDFVDNQNADGFSKPEICLSLQTSNQENFLLAGGYNEKALALFSINNGASFLNKITFENIDLDGISAACPGRGDSDFFISAKKSNKVYHLLLNSAQQVELIQEMDCTEIDFLEISPDKKYIYALSSSSNTLSIFQYNSYNDDYQLLENLFLTHFYDDFATPSCLKFDNTTNTAAISFQDGDCLAFFSVNPENGLFSLTDRYPEYGINKAEMNSPQSLTLDYQSGNFFLSTYYGNSIIKFKKEEKWKASTVYFNPAFLYRPRSIHYNSNQKFLYCCSSGNDSLLVLENQPSGDLFLTQKIDKESISGINTDGIRHIFSSKNEEYIITCSQNDNSLNIFKTK